MRKQIVLIQDCLEEIKLIRIYVIPEEREKLIKAEVQRINEYMAQINKSLKLTSCEEDDQRGADAAAKHLADLEAEEALEKEERTTSVEAESDSNVCKPSDT